ncbi:septal ring lytic transglycosylase RlpA family protein [Pedobacter glucosidilyticus]|uniref:septal ring lytic transglycosylase RlpA family protein n=1 Tax=Pedobacter glucosidilyticus TaxID=1122941 RepID=UPI0004799B0C|nr:septal ring lytic transglycosylase RlpA family protein [Pedobacter glucosidilyticus]
MKVLLLLSTFLLMNFSISFSNDKEKNLVQKQVRATYYASKFVGRKTSSGQVYTHDKFTAAHKTLPFGTEVTVVNPKNGKSVIVVVNDRGPFGKGLAIDLSQSAAREIGIMGQGIATVEISYSLPEVE